MTGRQRVMCALSFQEPDRVPRFFNVWDEFAEMWLRRYQLDDPSQVPMHMGSDIIIAPADETPWPSRVKLLDQKGDDIITRTGWGAVQRQNHKGKFSELLEPAISTRIDPDALVFEDPKLAHRYEHPAAIYAEYQEQFAVFGKTGGPYLRSAYIRGQEHFLMDIAEDPLWVRAFVEHVMDHLAAIGVEQIRRFNLRDSAIEINDDVCTNHGLIMGLASYERLFYPSLCKMVRAYKEAGVGKVVYHSDGDIRLLLDLLVAAGIDAINPLEARVCPSPLEVRSRYGDRLAIIGGLDNTGVLPRGNRNEVRRHLLGLLEAAKGGGFILAPHSIGPDVSVETMQFVLDLLDTHGKYPLAN